MVTGELRPQVDKVWDAFWSGGIANPVEVIEQITYLLFIRRLDELHTLAEKKAARTGQSIENPVFPEGLDDTARTPFSGVAPQGPETIFTEAQITDLIERIQLLDRSADPVPATA